MKILLTGASSYVGARLFLDLSKKYEVIGTYNDNQLSEKFIKLDITNPEEVSTVVQSQKPDIILHTAANANARWCESHHQEAVELNERSTGSLVEAANANNAKIIYISSFAAIDPVNTYGKTKRASEDLVKETKAGYAILRPSLVIGFSPNTTNDRPFNRILKNLDEKTPAVYDNSWKFQPTLIGHIAEVIDQVIAKNIMGETIPVAVNELTTRYDMARDILTPFGITVTAEDKHDTSPVAQTQLEQLEKFRLPQYSYSQIIEKIVSEIKHREQFETI